MVAVCPPPSCSPSPARSGTTIGHCRLDHSRRFLQRVCLFRFSLLHGWLLVAMAALSGLADSELHGQVLDKPRQLAAQSFWDNQDWDWYEQQIPFFECPDADVTTTYYYRWELLTKHLTYGSPNSGYSFTEFIDRPFWSGPYGSISCPAGFQLYEARWLRQPRIARDYLQYWFRTPGAQPRNYSTWLADSAWAINDVHRDPAFLVDLLPDLVQNYEGWEKRHFVSDVGLFWQTGHDDGMEFNINSRQTKDILRGAPSYRPSFNAYMWADAIAIAKIARLAGNVELATRFEQKAKALHAKMKQLLWDPQRQFFFPVFKNDEERDGYKIKALTRTYESGQFAGDPHGRELIGYVPWQFNLVERGQGYEAAWSKLMDRDGFFAPYGPSTVERNDPMFLLKKSCCWWSGQSWPYATTQTLKGLANLLQKPDGAASSTIPVTAQDYFTLLQIYSRSHRKDGKPYLAEALHPDTGSFEGHDGYNHSEHYFHSGFCDLIVTGLVGVIPSADDTLVIHPLAPAEWDYFALDDLPYRGHSLSVFWDRSGERYRRGKGFHVLLDGQRVGGSERLERLAIQGDSLRPAARVTAARDPRLVPTNFLVNNDGDYYPRISATHTGPNSSANKVIDGNYWYHVHPPNRWTTLGSPNSRDTLTAELGAPRPIHAVSLYFLDDGNNLVPPRSYEIEYWQDDKWVPIPGQRRAFDSPRGRRANRVTFPEIAVTKLRVTLEHQPAKFSGLTELEAWGDVQLPVVIAPPPAGNLAFNGSREGFPKATASFSDIYGGKPEKAIDGKIVYLPTPMNRWTSYGSPQASDWLEVDFGELREVGRAELHIYDDRGGVQPPASYQVEYHDGKAWKAVVKPVQTPEKPTGSTLNTVRFKRVTTTKVRVVFTHQGQARSGVTELELWKE